MKKNPITQISNQVDKAQAALDAIDLRRLRAEPEIRQAIHDARASLATAREGLDARSSRLEVVRTA
jgi:hypothetical protein